MIGKMLTSKAQSQLPPPERSQHQPQFVLEPHLLRRIVGQIFVMCNAWNHPSWCKCGFGGEGHRGGGTPDGPPNLFNYRTSRRWSGDDFCHPTKCPECGAKVYFIRHNGGSVWVDELGWPWPTHPCFEKESQTDTALQLLLQFAPSTEQPVPGIILQAALDGTKTIVYLEVRCETLERVSIEFKFDDLAKASFGDTGADPVEALAGSMVLVFRSNHQIFHSSLGGLQAIRMRFGPPAAPPQTLLSWRLCPVCDYWVDVRQFDSHTAQCRKESPAPSHVKPATLPPPTTPPPATVTVDQRQQTPTEDGLHRVPSGNRLNWSDEELARYQRRIVDAVNQATASLTDNAQANKDAKRLALEAINKLPRNLRKRLLHSFEEAKWRQVLRKRSQP